MAFFKILSPEEKARRDQQREFLARQKRLEREERERQARLQRDDRERQKRVQRESNQRYNLQLEQIRNQQSATPARSVQKSSSAWENRKDKYEGKIALQRRRTERILRPRRIAWGLIILILVVVLYVLYSLSFLPPTVQSAINEGVNKLKDIGTSGYFQKTWAQLTFSNFQTTVSDIGTWKAPRSYQDQKEEKGIKVQNFEAYGFFDENDPIDVRGELLAKNLDDEFKVRIACSLEDYEDVSYVRLPGEDKTGEVVETKFSEEDNDRFVDFICQFPKGISVKEKDLFGVKGNVPKEVSKKVFVNITSDYEIRTVLQVYTIGEEKLKEYGARDVFAVTNTKSLLYKQSLWGGEGYILSKQENYGPMQLALGMGNQPYTNRDNKIEGHVIVMNLQDGSFTTGEMKELKSLSFRLPEHITVNKDSCPDFETKSGEREWKLKEKIIEEINTCEESCGFRKNDLSFYCELKIKVETNKELKSSLIIANAEYTYEAVDDTYVYIKPFLRREVSDETVG